MLNNKETTTDMSSESNTTSPFSQMNGTEFKYFSACIEISAQDKCLGADACDLLFSRIAKFGGFQGCAFKRVNLKLITEAFEARGFTVTTYQNNADLYHSIQWRSNPNDNILDCEHRHLDSDSDSD